MIFLRSLILASDEAGCIFPGEHLLALRFIFKTVIVLANQFAELRV